MLSRWKQDLERQGSERRVFRAVRSIAVLLLQLWVMPRSGRLLVWSRLNLGSLYSPP
jgi:hypothetical protein